MWHRPCRVFFFLVICLRKEAHKMVQHYNDIHLVCYEQSCLVERKKKLIETHYIHTHKNTKCYYRLYALVYIIYIPIYIYLIRIKCFIWWCYKTHARNLVICIGFPNNPKGKKKKKIERKEYYIYKDVEWE